VVVRYTVESKVETARKAVGKDAKTGGEEGDGWRSVRELARSDGSAPVAVNVDPGVEVGGTVETTVTVTGGLLTTLGGERVGGGELASGRGEIPVGGRDVTSVSGKEEMSVDGEDVMSVSGKDVGSVSGKDVGSVSGKDEISVSGNELVSVSGKDVVRVGGNDEISVGGKDERSRMDRLGADGDTVLGEGGEVLKDVRDGMEMVVPVGVDVGKLVSSENDGREEDWVEPRVVMEGDVLELDGGTVELESEGWDDEELVGSGVVVGDVFGSLLDGLEVELDSTGGLDVGVKEDEEDVELEELDERVEVDPGSVSERTTNEGKELVDSESVGVGVVVDREMDDDSVLVIVEDVRLELE
jgi:hypothetical protein